MKKIVYYALILICVCALGFSAYKIIDYATETKKGNSAYSELQDKSVTSHKSKDKGKPPIEIDFDKLKAENDDIIAWLYCEGTPINYPVMRSKDNLDYLRHLPDGTYNRYGSPFLDYRCSDDFSDFLSIIYGHNMKNDAMFGTLPEYKSQKYYNSHKIIYCLTPDKNYAVELISGFETDAHSEAYTFMRFNKEKADYISDMKSKSDFSSEVTATPRDNLILLSTCAYSETDSRYILLGKLTELN